MCVCIYAYLCVYMYVYVCPYMCVYMCTCVLGNKLETERVSKVSDVKIRSASLPESLDPAMEWVQLKEAPSVANGVLGPSFQKS